MFVLREQLDEWLVLDGIHRFGTIEQRVIAAFVLVDTSHDGKLQNVEVDQLFRICVQAADIEVQEIQIMRAVNKVMEADKDVCTLPYSVVLHANRLVAYVLVFCVAVRFRFCSVLRQSNGVELSELIEAARKDPEIYRLIKVV